MARTATKLAPKKRDLIEELTALRDTIRDLDKQVADLKSQKKELENNIMEVLDSEGLQMMSTEFGTVSVSEKEVASVEDWDQYHAWIRKNNAFYLLQRRTNDAPYRELMASRRGRKIPGVSTVKVKTLSLRKK